MNRLLFLCFLIIVSCEKTKTEQPQKIIVLQPLGSFHSVSANEVLEKIKKINPNVVLRESTDFPVGSY